MHLRKYNHKCVPGSGGEFFDSSDSHGEGAVTPVIGGILNKKFLMTFYPNF